MKVSIGQLHLLELRLKDVLQYKTFAIAGGAVRDAFFGREVKDIDVFIAMGDRTGEDWSDYDAERGIVSKISKAFGNAGGVYDVTSESGYSAMADEEQVYATYEVEHPIFPKLNLIFVQYLDDALNEFPDTLSQVFLRDGKVESSEGFDKVAVGILNGREVAVPTYLKADNKRLARLSEKYPEVVWAVEAPYRELGLVTDDFQWA